MNNLIQFETAEELIAAFANTDAAIPKMPETVGLAIEERSSGRARLFLTGDGSRAYAVAETMTINELLDAALRQCGCKTILRS